MAKKAAKKRVAKKAATPRRRRNNPGIVDDIPTISASTLRSSISATPAPAGGALITKVTPVAGPQSDKMLDDTKFRIFREGDDSCADGNDYDTLKQALDAAKSQGQTDMNDNDDDAAYIEIWQLVGKVDCEKIDDVKSTVSLYGSSPA